MTDLQIGDQVTVDWDRKIDRHDGGPYDRGVVESIARWVISIRHPNGYTFAVSKADLASGTKITVKERDAND